MADISIPPVAIEEENVALSLITLRDVQPLIPPRLAETHKGTYGHVGVIAGAPGRSGAAVLAARGAIRGGAGLVTVMTDAETAKLVHAGSIESMTYSGKDLDEFLKNKDAVVIGPGMATDRKIVDRIDAMTEKKPLIAQAQAT